MYVCGGGVCSLQAFSSILPIPVLSLPRAILCGGIVHVSYVWATSIRWGGEDRVHFPA